LTGDMAYKEHLAQFEKRHLDAVRDLIGIESRARFWRK